MIVMKFGGTSVEDSAAILRLIEIVESEIPRRPIVVVSACAGVTNQLLKIAALSAEGKKEESNDLISAIRSRHDKLVDELMSSELPKNYLKGKISVYAHELRNLSQAISVLGEVSNRSRDAIASYGERLSSMITAQAMEENSIKAALVDAREYMITNETYTKAVPLFEIVGEKTKKALMPLVNGGYVVVTQGFIGASEKGITTTIGRGGSDYSAAIIGALLGAEEIQIWTDVDGVLTADPSIVTEARRIKKMSFNEASELAYFGAKVLHPMTILPAIEKNIPVYVRNSRNPSYRGTLISRSENHEECIVKSIVYKEHITLLNLVSSRMFMAHDFLEAVFAVFNKYKTIAHAVATSEVSISVAIDDTTKLEEMKKEFDEFAEVTSSSGKAIVCVVGENIRHSPGIVGKIFSAMDGIRVNMISQGASEINIGFVVDENDLERAVQLLHKDLFGNSRGLSSEIFD
ncbi:MAG TPA: lysine-sensitive aspartokinase 3 [Candidatus Acidoferrales bacterium]|nr:lysine-sensitive aspartokinase 3 [Candidatus Acidoferrales bacterium]